MASSTVGAGVSPGDTEDMVTIRRFYASRLQIAIAILGEIARAHQLVEATLFPSFGFFQGGGETSFILKLTGEPVHIFGTVAEWGKGHSQRAVRIISPGPGEGFRVALLLRTPMSAVGIATFLNNLRRNKLSLTLLENEHHQITHIEYWGNTSDDYREVALIHRFLTQLMPLENIIVKLKDGYQVIDVNEDEYDTFIQASAPGRYVLAASYAKRYPSILDDSSSMSSAE